MNASAHLSTSRPTTQERRYAIFSLGSSTASITLHMWLLQAVLDHISAMTDVYALDLYRKLNGMSLPAGGRPYRKRREENEKC